MERIKVFSPGSIGNVGSGFDVFGLAIEAIGDTIEVSKNTLGELRIKEIIGDSSISTNSEKNIVTVGVRALLDYLNSEQGFDFKINKGVSGGSGMGSSGCSATAGVFAVNELINGGLTRKELLPFAAVGEQIASKEVHFDNIGPSMLGGLSVIRSIEPLEILEIDVPDNLFLAMVKPGIVIKTDEAKKLIPADLPLKTAIKQFGQISGLITGMLKVDIDLIGRSLEDYVATPYRSELIPKFNEAKVQALNSGAAGFNISGSGPAMFAICDGEAIAISVLTALKKLYADDDKAKFYLTKPDTLGTRVI